MIQQLLNVASILWFVAVILTIILFFVALLIHKQGLSPHPVGWFWRLILAALCTMYTFVFYYMEWTDHVPFLTKIQEWFFLAPFILTLYFWRKCEKSADRPLF
jgi:Ca2+/Na+ antiporter